MNKLLKKTIVRTQMTLLSGLHIGDSKETTEIGGIDAPVVRRKDNREPYIPGSSIKGKVRCLLEQIDGAAKVGNSEKVNAVFGLAEKNNTQTSRVIFRDAYFARNNSDYSADNIYQILRDSEYTDMPFSEMKVENTIDRVLGKAKDGGIRNIERIPAGIKFNIEVVINHFEAENNNARELLIEGFKALNNDYLGGSGTRGYGHVKVDLPEDAGTSWKEETIAFDKVFN
ncbi:MAG: type III-A CRISPR-associated RAMP protein Csm3 [Candidatus Kuenenia stuttgartiensis]|nr:type III-A CRISPR-associated RAMP protein Csm3 [Candidatus Kuenenia stuttgartiensis]